MDYVQPEDVVSSMVDAGSSKGRLSAQQLLLRGALAGAFLGVSASLAVTTSAQTGLPIAGALIFPVGFVMIVLLGLDLVTGSFALLPLGVIEGRIGIGQLVKNWVWVFVGNLIGGVLYACLLAIVLTNAGATPTNATGKALIKLAEAKTTGYAQYGAEGMLTAFVKGMLCNWLVCLGVVMGMVSTSAVGKILGAWLPILVFFALGFEHTVVNMFVIPCGMLLGAHVTLVDWWVWNQVPVTAGNLVGGLTFTGLALYYAHRRPRGQQKPAVQSPAAAMAYETKP
jgi:formate/nitrite transporter